jgi:uncharacterized zinc-type alcohol dehydrogenase-like protein
VACPGNIKEDIMRKIQAWAALSRGTKLSRYDYEVGDLDADQVEIAVDHCGLCHSDLALMTSEWSAASYPLIPGHEVVGRVVALGSAAKGLRIGQRVGVGWYAHSCGHCRFCIGGEQQLCNLRQPTIVGRHGGFADHLRVNWLWAIPLPPSLSATDAGPLMCGGLTVFFPFWLHGISPTSHIGILGIGGLGHMGLQFARAWGCEVTALTSHPDKAEDARALGAHHVVSWKDKDVLRRLAGSLDMLLVTAGTPLSMSPLLEVLAAKGRLHHVGITTEPVQYEIRPHLISRQRSISGSSNGSPAAVATMLDFAARHQILPKVERYPMARINDAIERLRIDKARYRIVLDADFA